LLRLTGTEATETERRSRILRRRPQRRRGQYPPATSNRTHPEMELVTVPAIVVLAASGRDKNNVFRKNFGVLGQAGGERRLNVAVTRAREKIILPTSMPIGEISEMLALRQPPARARDYLQAYLDYASKIAAGELEAGRASAERLGPQDRMQKPRNGHDDGFVRSVATFLRELRPCLPRLADRAQHRHGCSAGSLTDAKTGHFALRYVRRSESMGGFRAVHQGRSRPLEQVEAGGPEVAGFVEM
jgi:hypothetical protein